jgi:hypothetical protein
VALKAEAGFDNFDAFTREEFFLERSIRLANEDFAVISDHAVPGNAFPGGCGRHSAAGTASTAAEAQDSS